MGSDGFESKKLGGPSVGTGPNRVGPGEFSGGAERDPAIDALSGLGDTAAHLVEISGVIKWFDASKGYGFIVPDNGWPDVLLHVTVLRRDGYQTAYEGARLVCEWVQRDADQRPRAAPGQMVQPLARIRFPDLRGGDTGHFRAYGNAAPVRYDRTAPGPICPGTLRARLQGHDGCRNTTGNR